MQSEGWMLALLGLLAVVASSASAAALNPQPGATHLRLSVTTTADDGKDAGFTNCCQSKGIIQSEEALTDCCTYSHLHCPITTIGALSGQQLSDWVKCFGDSQDDTECCEQAGLGEESLYSCDYTPPLMNFTRWAEPTWTQKGLAIVMSCAIEGAYNEADDGIPSSESSERSISEESSESDESPSSSEHSSTDESSESDGEDDEESNGSSEDEEDVAKDTGFYDCCEWNGLFESEADRALCCNYTSADWSIGDCRQLVEGLTLVEKSHLLKCYGDSRNNTDCCVESGVGQEYLYACDYSTPHVDFDQWVKALESAKWKATKITHCVYSNAYNERD